MYLNEIEMILGSSPRGRNAMCCTLMETFIIFALYVNTIDVSRDNVFSSIKNIVVMILVAKPIFHIRLGSANHA